MVSPFIIACPGCSMLNLFATIPNEAHHRLVILIVIMLFGLTIAAIIWCKKSPSGEYRGKKIRKWIYTILLFAGWILALSDKGSNFGFLLLHWLYLPLVIQFNLGLCIFWDLAILLLLPIFIIPAFYCYFLAKIFCRIDRKL